MIWAEKYVLEGGGSWRDCGAFVADVLRREFGRRVAAPVPSESLSVRDRQFAGASWDEFASPATAPRNGGRVLDAAAGRRGAPAITSASGGPGYGAGFTPPRAGAVRPQSWPSAGPLHARGLLPMARVT